MPSFYGAHDGFFLAFGWSLIDLLWQGACVALALAISLRAARRMSARARYAMACAGLGMIVVCPVLTWVSQTQAISAPSSGRNARTASLLTRAIGTSSELPIAHELSAAISWINFHMGALLLVWLLGAGFMLLRILRSMVAVRRIQDFAKDGISKQSERRVHELANRLKLSSSPCVKSSSQIAAPVVAGWLKPAILLPGSLMEVLSEPQKEAILVHELVHIQRRDVLVNLLQTVIEAVLFYQPAVWWISREIRREREHCCDDCAVRTSGSAIEYAKALVVLEERRGMAELKFSMGLHGGDLSMRIKRLVEPAEPARAVRRLSAALAVLGASTAFALVLLSNAATRRVMAQTETRAAQSKAEAFLPTSHFARPDLACTYYDAKSNAYDGVCEGSYTDSSESYCRQIGGSQPREHQSSCTWKLKRLQEWKMAQEKSKK